MQLKRDINIVNVPLATPVSEVERKFEEQGIVNVQMKSSMRRKKIDK